MLGSYSQNALSGAANCKSDFFMVQQITLGIGEGFVVLGAQYWGQGRMQPIRKLTGIALKLGLICGIITILICTFIPHLVISIFTNDPEIIAEGVAYLGIIKYTFLLFIITNVLMAALRCVETVKISFYISIVSLIVNGNQLCADLRTIRCTGAWYSWCSDRNTGSTYCRTGELLLYTC